MHTINLIIIFIFIIFPCISFAGQNITGNLYVSGNVGIGTFSFTNKLTVYPSGSGTGIDVNYIPSGIGGCDNYSVLLSHYDSDFTDSNCSGSGAKTVSSTGGVTIDTSHKKFGAGSVNFDGSTGYLTIPNSTDFNFGSGDFTVDWQVFFSSLPASTFPNDQVLFDNINGGDGMLVIYDKSGGNERVRFFSNAFDTGNVTWTPSTSTWYHFAIVRSGNNFNFYMNGSSIASGSSSTAFADPATRLMIGARDSGPTRWFAGNLDEFRISKGIARWTSNFTPPAAPYDTGSPIAIPSIILKSNGTQTAKIWTDGNNSDILKFDNTNTTRMTISSGNVGIGTTIPQGGLIVMNGNVGLGTWTPTQTLTVIGNVGIGTTISNTLMGSFSPASPGGQVYIQGNVGLGTLIPASKLTIATSQLMQKVTTTNTACNTVCGQMGCYFGEDTGVLGTLLDCTDATADVCFCSK